jgi:hypothetical protein
VFYNAVSAMVSPGSNCPLSNTGPGNTSGFTLTGGNTVQVAQAGTYLISYQVEVFNTSAAYALFVNGTQVQGTVSVGTSTAAVKLLAKATIVTLTTNNTVNVRNVGNLTDTLEGAVEGQQSTNVLIVIQRVS